MERGVSCECAGTIKQTAAGYPVELRNVKLDDPGDYAVLEVGKILYTAYKDGGLVSFVTNAFPSVMPKVPKRQTKSSVIKHVFVPPVSPAYNKFMGGVAKASNAMALIGNLSALGFAYFLNSLIMLFTMLTSCTSTTVGILV